MTEPIGKIKLEAIQNAAERHRSQMQSAWEQANINAVFEVIQQARFVKKVKLAKSGSNAKH